MTNHGGQRRLSAKTCYRLATGYYMEGVWSQQGCTDSIYNLYTIAAVLLSICLQLAWLWHVALAVLRPTLVRLLMVYYKSLPQHKWMIALCNE
jgi:hypothetical protein